MSDKPLEETTEVNESELIFNCAKGLLEIGQAISSINESIGDMCVFLSDRVLNIGERKGYAQQSQEQGTCQCQKEDCGDRPNTSLSVGETTVGKDDVAFVNNQKTMCVGHTNDPGQIETKPPEDVKTEVASLVNKIRSGS